jgi:hypothetical protein
MRQQTHRSIVHLLLTVAGMSGIAGLFLPFTYGTSPVDAAFTDLWRLALPFFLAILASAASLRWVISGSFSARERAIAYVVSASMAGVTLSQWFPFEVKPANNQEWFALVSPGPILALGVYFLIRNSRMESSSKFNPVMAIQIAYLANAVLCLITFFPDWQLGAYCVLVAALVFVLQIVVASAPGPDVVKS